MPTPAKIAGLPPWLPAVFDVLSDAIVGLDDAGRVRFLNRAATLLIGKEAADATGHPLADVLPLIDEVTQEPFPPRAGWRNAPAPVPDPRSTRRRRVRIGDDGEDRVLEAVFLRFAGAPLDSTAALLVLRDRSAQLRAEIALRELDERHRGFIEQSSAGIWRAALTARLPIDVPEDQQIEALYRDSVIAEGNEVLAHMYGIADASELIGKRLDDVLPRADPHNLDLLRSFIRSGYRLSGAESHEIDKDGNPKYFLKNVTGVVEEGCLVGAWGTQVDITRQKREAGINYHFVKPVEPLVLRRLLAALPVSAGL